MNWIQVKDPLCDLCPRGTAASSLSLTQEILGLGTEILLIFNFFSIPQLNDTEFVEFSQNILGKLQEVCIFHFALFHHHCGFFSDLCMRMNSQYINLVTFPWQLDSLFCTHTSH